jgi:serine phosphatase RsbU (regulator of sigma subunit)/Tfp pilus assembly protein PilF
MRAILYSIFFIVFIQGILKSQSDVKKDSLLLAIKTAKNDTTKVNAMLSTSNYLMDKEPNEAYIIIIEAMRLATKIKWNRGKEESYITKGQYYYSQSEFTKTLECWQEALKYKETRNDKEGMAFIRGKIGLIYWNLDDDKKALDYIFQALKEFELQGNKPKSAIQKGNIGMIYFKMKDYEKALSFFFEALAVAEKENLYTLKKNTIGNIGVVYYTQKKYEKAKEFFLKSLELHQNINDKQGISRQSGNIGILYVKAPHLAFEKGNNKTGLVLAEEYLDKALKLSTEYGAQKLMSEQEEYLSQLEEKKGNWKNAIYRYKKHILLRDSINSEENKKLIVKKEIQYEFDKKAAADSVAYAKESEVSSALLKQKEAEIKSKQLQQWGLGVGLLIVIAFSVFLYNRIKITQRQKHVIELQKKEVERQKHLVDEKNHEILDSITYAKRIQSAILPPQRLIKVFLPNSFVLYKPKDIVAGDFYWLETPSENGEIVKPIMIAAADCTGHGVPGAMVSVVCNNALNRSVREFGLTEPGKILDKTRELVIEEFQKSDEEVKDGMDISLCCLNNKTLSWSGANNPLWIVRNNKNGVTELVEVKPDKQPIGKYADTKSFTTHTIELFENDTLYIFTDGYQDQFGGPKGKKFMAKNLKELLVTIHQESMEKQKQILDNAFTEWVGDLEQIDDVTFIGIRVS